MLAVVSVVCASKILTYCANRTADAGTARSVAEMAIASCIVERCGGEERDSIKVLGELAECG